MSSEPSLTKLGSESTQDGVLILTINDPATRNALDDVLMSELASGIQLRAGDQRFFAHSVC